MGTDPLSLVVSVYTAAAVLMAMNNVYYRFRHMVGKPSYQTKPARLRMNRIAKPLGSRVDRHAGIGLGEINVVNQGHPYCHHILSFLLRPDALRCGIFGSKLAK